MLYAKPVYHVFSPVDTHQVTLRPEPMPSWFHKKTPDGLKLQNKEDIVEHIHKIVSEDPEAFVETEWECSNAEDDYRGGDWIKDRKKWSDAPFHGDWDRLLKVQLPCTRRARS